VPDEVITFTPFTTEPISDEREVDVAGTGGTKKAFKTGAESWDKAYAFMTKTDFWELTVNVTGTF
jgi:hypothetical protein